MAALAKHGRWGSALAATVTGFPAGPGATPRRVAGLTGWLAGAGITLSQQPCSQVLHCPVTPAAAASAARRREVDGGPCSTCEVPRGAPQVPGTVRVGARRGQVRRHSWTRRCVRCVNSAPCCSLQSRIAARSEQVVELCAAGGGVQWHGCGHTLVPELVFVALVHVQCRRGRRIRMYTCTCTYTYTHVHTCTCTHACVCTCVYTIRKNIQCGRETPCT